MINKNNKELLKRLKNMEKLIFKIIKKPTKKGEAYYFSITIDFIRSKKIDPKKDYEILVFEI